MPSLPCLVLKQYCRNEFTFGGDRKQVYGGSLYIVCPTGADPKEFEARKREWMLYESVIKLEETFQAVMEAKNQAVVRKTFFL